MTKAEIRETLWTRIDDAGVGRFPGTYGRIPNFDGADAAARRLGELAVWSHSLVLKVDADAPQLPLRRAALAAGKIVYMAVPKLRSEKCFVELDPRRLGGAAVCAASIVGACRYGRLVAPREMRPIDLVVAGAVAVSRGGARLGKGGGYADLEYAVLREEGKIRESTPILTTVHAVQIVRHRIPMLAHDVPVDFIVTPDGAMAARATHPRPRGIYWDLLRPMRISKIPLLRKRLNGRIAGAPSPATT
jgi:5-formyltetrahydrofolate cyclo-ligase